MQRFRVLLPGDRPPLGALYLSAFLKQAGYPSVRVLHLDALGMDAAGLRAELLSSDRT